jgi:hypothetical protein
VLPDTGIDDVKKQRNAEYAKHINDPVLLSLKMEGIRLLFFMVLSRCSDSWTSDLTTYVLCLYRRIKSSNILDLNILQKPCFVIAACKYILHHTSTYSCIPEDEPSGSKHVEDIVNIKRVVYNKGAFCVRKLPAVVAEWALCCALT